MNTVDGLVTFGTSFCTVFSNIESCCASRPLILRLGFLKVFENDQSEFKNGNNIHYLIEMLAFLGDLLSGCEF
jgi:hypothetical protein